MITITISINEKELKHLTIPAVITPIHEEKPIKYNQINIKRTYYKKGEAWYHKKPCKPICKPQPKTILKTLISDKVVKQEPLLVVH